MFHSPERRHRIRLSQTKYCKSMILLTVNPWLLYVTGERWRLWSNWFYNILWYFRIKKKFSISYRYSLRYRILNGCPLWWDMGNRCNILNLGSNFFHLKEGTGNAWAGHKIAMTSFRFRSIHDLRWSFEESAGERTPTGSTHRRNARSKRTDFFSIEIISHQRVRIGIR